MGGDLGFYLVQALTGLSSASALFLVASGLSIIFGVTRVVNFAHGSFYMLGAYIAYTLIGHLGGALGFWAAVLLAGVAVGIIGVVVEAADSCGGCTRRRSSSSSSRTFGVILVIQDLALLVWGAEDLFGPAAPGLEGTVNLLGTRLPEYDLALIALSLVVLGALWLLFQRTPLGHPGPGRDRGPGDGGCARRQPGVAVHRRPSSSARCSRGSGAPPSSRREAPTSSWTSTSSPRCSWSSWSAGWAASPGAFLAAVLISELGAFGILLIPQSTLVLMFAGDGGGPHLPALGAARPPGGARTARAGGAARTAAPAAPAPAPGGGPAPARGAACPAGVRGRLHPGARGRDRNHGALRGQPALRDGSRRDGLVRARRLLRGRRVRGGPFW